MKDKGWAVAVGYNFGFVPGEELSGINLDNVGAVRFEGVNYNLYKAKTYEDSRKIDTLLDKHGEYPIKDYKIEPVIMSGEFEMILPGFDKERDGIGFGSYTFNCEGKEIPIDFSGTSWDIEQLEQDEDKITVSFETGRTWMNTDCFLDDCYEDDYKNAGLRINDITAEFLSKATQIIDFYIDGEIDGEEFATENLPEGGKFTLKSLCFSDGIKDYPVKDEVIKEYNNSLNAVEIKLPSIKEANIKGLYFEDTADGLDNYLDAYGYSCHVSHNPIVFSPEFPDNMDRAVDEEFRNVFRDKLLVKSCDYGCDTYPNGVAKTIEGKGVYTFQSKVWEFISQMEKTFNCKCSYPDNYNGFEFAFEFGPEDKKGCYIICAGNNGQEYSEVLYLKDWLHICDKDFVDALVAIDRNIYVLLEENNLKVRPREINKSLDNKIAEAKDKQSDSQDKSNKYIEPSR